MIVHWTDTALSHLLAIHGYIASDSPEYAHRMVDRITRRSEQIALYPEAGRRVPEYDTPEIREVIEWPYRIIYRSSPDRIDIVAVIHGARELPPRQ